MRRRTRRRGEPRCRPACARDDRPGRRPRSRSPVAAGLLAGLAGIHLTAKRVERSAEADGGAAGRAISAEADAIRARQVVLLPPAGPLPDKLYIAVDGTGVPGRRPRRPKGRPGKGRRRPGPHPRGQARLPVHPDQPSMTTATRPATPASVHLPGHLRTRRPVRSARGRRSPPPRHRAHPPACRPRRRSSLDLENRRPALPRRHPDRRPLPRPRAPPRPRRPRRPPPRESHRDDWLAERRARNSTPGTSAALLAAGRDLHFTGSLVPRARQSRWPTSTVNAHRMRYAALHVRLGMFVGSGVVEAGCEVLSASA